MSVFVSNQLNELKEKIKLILEERKKIEVSNTIPQPRYDDIFYKGLNWLNKQ